MRILGVHDGHHAVACPYTDGEVVATMQEERLTIVEGWFGSPEQSIRAVLEIGSCRIKDLERVT